MRNAIRNLAWVVVGAAAAWVAMRPWRDERPLAFLRGPASLATPAAGRPVSSAARRPQPEPDLVTSPDAQATLAPSRTETAPDAALRATPTNPTVLWNPPKDLRITPTDIPNRRPDDAGGRRPATDLLD